VLDRAQALGFLGPGPVTDHIDRSLAFVEAWSQVRGRTAPTTLLDLGSGGGVPGLVLALVWRHCAVTLLDGSDRRVAFLQEVVTALGLASRVGAVAERAEVAGHGPLRFGFDLVVARGFAAPAVTAECGGAFLRPGGSILAVAEPPGGDSRRWPPASLAQLGLGLGPLITEQATVQVIEPVDDFPDRYPRRVGVPTKRPLWVALP
jgi:16S rRNA (guanine527-N7)-methyltransferase